MAFRGWGIPVAAAVLTLSLPAPPTAARTAPEPPSKVAWLVKDRADQVKSAVSRGERLSRKQAHELSSPYLSVNTDAMLDLEIHALAPVGAKEWADLVKLGAQVLVSSADFEKPRKVKKLPPIGIFRALVPYDAVDAVGALPWVAAVRPTEHATPDAGPILAEGSQLHRADEVQALGVNGSGQTVGVVSDGVVNRADAQATGELPTSLTVLNQGSGNEGTAMLEIVHDLAPGAALMFDASGGGVASHVAALINLAANGADIISEDIPFDGEPAFQQGMAATTAETLATSGVWVSSSGGNLGDSHAARVAATGTGTSPDGNAVGSGCGTRPPTNTVAVAGGGDTTFDVRIRPGATLDGTLQWSEPRAIFPTAGLGGFTDLDLFLVDGSNNCLAMSTATQGGGQGDTIEQISFTNPSATGNLDAKLVVNAFGGTGAVAAPVIDLRWRGDTRSLDTPDRSGALNPDSNYVGDATSAGAVDAGVDQDPATVPLEDYSAGGPVRLLSTTICADGDAPPCTGVSGGNGRTVIGPTYASADGVSVSGAGGFGSGVCPAITQGQCQFFGTSAATPSAAGVAALVRQALGGSPTPAQLTAVLNANATDRGNAGPDNRFGAGVLDAFSAVSNRADLNIGKNCLPNDPVPAGSAFTCTITVGNAGPAVARAVKVTDTAISSGSVSLAATTPGCTASGAEVRCSLGALASGATRVITVTGTADEPQDIADTAEVTSGTIDPRLDDNKASDTVRVVGRADLSLTKSAPATANAGEVITYTLTGSNSGPSTASNVVITDQPPAKVTVQSVTGNLGATCTAGPPARCRFGSVAPGGPAPTMRITAKIAPDATGTIINDASIASDTTDPNTSNNAATASTALSAAANLAVTKLDSPDPVPAGRRLSYTVNVSNLGPSVAEGVRLTDTLPDQVDFASAEVTSGPRARPTTP